MSSESQVASHLKRKGKRYFSWTVDMDRVMGACFIDQMNQGNKLDGKCAWKPVAYTVVINALEEQLNVPVTKAHIQARFKTWGKHYDILHPLLQSCNSSSAITWDHSRGRIEVHDENIWRERLMANPKLGPYRRKIVVENWEEICILFSEDPSSGEGAQTAFEANANGEDAQTVFEGDADLEAEESMNIEESFDTDPQSAEHLVMNTLLAQQQSKSKNKSSAGTRGTKRKLARSQALCKVLIRMADLLERYLDSKSSKVTAEIVLHELRKVDLNERQLLKGVDLLMHDDRKFDTLSGLPIGLKKQWLLMHIGKCSCTD